MKIRNRKSFVISYTFLFVGIFLIIFLPVFLKGNTLVSDTDCFNQFYPAFVYIGNYLRECVSQGKIIEFDFTIGMGEGVFQVLNYYGFGDPLNLLSVFASGEYSYYLFSVLLMVRFWLCGFSMAFYCRKTGKRWEASLAAALTYCFSSFLLIKGMQFYTYITGMLLLPLIMLGMYELVYKERKLSKWFVLGIFLQAINGFYFLYMDTALLLVYYLIIFISKKQKKWKEFWIKGWQIAANYIAGIALGAVIFIPAVIGFFSSTRTAANDLSIVELLFWNTSVYSDYIGNLFIARGYANGELAFLAVQIACLIAFFSLKGKTEWKILSIIVSIGYFIPFIGYAMNGFSYSSDRWVYIIHFIFTVIMAETLESSIVWNIKSTLLYTGLITVTSVVHLMTYYEGISDFVRVFLYLILQVGVLCCFAGKRKRRVFLPVLLLGNIILNGCMIYGPVVLGGDGYSSSFAKFSDLAGAFWKSESAQIEQDKEDWSRADIKGDSYGTAMAVGMRGTAEYLSILNKNVSDFYQTLEISPGMHGSSWTLGGLDGRSTIEDILSVDYVQKQEKKNGEIITTVVENKDSLPCGFAYDTFLTEEEFRKLKAPDKDAALLQSVILEKSPGEKWTRGEVSAGSKKLEFHESRIDLTDEKTFHTSDNSKILLDISDKTEGEVFVRFADLFLKSELTNVLQIGNKQLQLLQDKYLIQQFGHDQKDYWVKVDLEENNNTLEIAFPEDQVYSLGDIELYERSTERDAEWKKLLEKDRLQNLSMQSDKIEGDISLDKNKILFLSIPYSDGWSALVDGEEAKIWKANIGFCALPLTEGTHHIELVYRTPGLRFGMFISSMAFLSLSGIFWSSHCKNKR